MYRRPRKILLRKMLREIKRLKVEFAKESGSTESILSEHLQNNLQWIENELHSSYDLMVRQFSLGFKDMRQAAIVFIEGLVDKKQIEWSILQPLMVPAEPIMPLSADDLLFYIKSRLITVGDIKFQEDPARIVESILSGNTALLIDGIVSTLIISTPGWEKRGITEPDSEVNICGSREGFIETLRTNTAMLRRYLGHPDLTFISMTIGQKTRTDLCIAYLNGIAPDSLITEIRRRLLRVKTDLILGAREVEQFIEDHPLSPFSTIGSSERPDVVAAKLAEGRAAILVDGSPDVLTVPFLFVENFQYPDDYNFHFIYATLIRWIRYTAFLFSFLTPAAFVALTTFHQELLPTPLLITIAAATEGTPFLKVVEVIVMGLLFELIREGGIRLPRPIGQAISIVGALVIGQVTVQAGLVGAPTLIVIAITAVTTFVFPTLVDETTPLRILLVIFTGFLGAFGLMISVLTILIHLVTIRSFGVPYLAPMSPINLRGLGQDVLVRAPWWMMWKRPKMITSGDPERQRFRLIPHPPADSKDKSAK